MRIHQWITLEEFSANHNVNSTNVSSMKSQNRFPDTAFSKERGNLFIDENFFIRREKFRDTAVHYCQEYMILLQMRYTLNEITDSLLKYYGGSKPSMLLYISSILYMTNDNSILDYKLNSRLIKVFRFCRKVNRALNKKHNINFCVTQELDYYI